MSITPGSPIVSPAYTIPIGVFRGIHWGGFALCLIAFSGRMYIRLLCFHRFLLEDLLIFVALAFLLTSSVLTQTGLPYVYSTTAISLGALKPTANFWDNNLKGLRALLAHLVLSIIGIWLVKLNFLLFFRRLICNLSRKYQILWWFTLIFTLGCCGATFELTRFNCLFGDPIKIQRLCNSPPELRKASIGNIASATLDVISDILILCIPISIVWKVQLTARKKLVLSIVFSLTLITVALTITRGAFFIEAYHDTTGKVFNTTWFWFWYSMELVTSILIACIVSFRTIFIVQAKSNESRAQRLAHIHPAGQVRRRVRGLYDSVLDTCRTLEGITRAEDEIYVLSELSSGLVTMDFSPESHDGWRKDLQRSSNDHAESIHTFTR
ncbi:hypothetical protein F4811DRAFT_391072 [Daldinia bambusicola]|nr:hypothetical protein F4811DRAFT_391072 [Daldinia bambusicola]